MVNDSNAFLEVNNTVGQGVKVTSLNTRECYKVIYGPTPKSHLKKPPEDVLAIVKSGNRIFQLFKSFQNNSK